MGSKDNLVVGLDIGTTKISAIVGEITPNGVDIVGIGTHPSKGLRKGVVINIESTIQSITQAIQEAELMAGCEIHSVYAGISGGHVRGFNSHGVVAVQDREVKATDIARVIDAAKAVAIPTDRDILHVLPKEYIVDDQDEIKDPVGMSGVRLEAKVHIVTGAATSAQNIIKCCNRCGLTVEGIVLEPLASGETVLTQDEKDLGVVVIDIGGGTTDLAIYSQGTIHHTAVLALGGQHLTNDIAIGIRTPTLEAERIKHACGCALARSTNSEDMIEVPSVGGRKPRRISRHLLGEILQPRVEEIFSLVRQEIDKSGFSHLIASGVVLTGGTALLEGINDVAENVFELPVRTGIPQGFGGLIDVVSSPEYATAVGLVLYGARRPTRQTKFGKFEPTVYTRMKSKMKHWFGEFF